MSRKLAEFCKRGHLMAETRVRHARNARSTCCGKCVKLRASKNRRHGAYRYKYGITLRQYNRMNAAQHGLCAICGKLPKGPRLAVDHDHTDGHVRQLLCESCNTGIACFNDSVQHLEEAVRYMRKHSQLRLVG